MSIEQMSPEESREKQIHQLLTRLRTLQMQYWLPGLDIEDKSDVENQVDDVCTRLVTLGVDLESLDRNDTPLG